MIRLHALVVILVSQKHKFFYVEEEFFCVEDNANFSKSTQNVSRT